MISTKLTCRAAAAMIALSLSLPAWASHEPDLLPDIPLGDIAVRLRPVATGLAAPLYGINPPGDTGRMFVLEQNGLVLVLENGALLPAPALDLRSIVSPPLNPASPNDERGLLGLAFHPGFSNSLSPGFRTLYTYHSEVIGGGATYPVPTDGGGVNNYKNVIAEWKISAANPNVIDPASRREVLSFGKDAGNHNGGTIAFGPDGYLYAAPGDGGNRDDQGPGHIEPGGNSQNLSTPLGKVLRIDPLHPSLTGTSSDPASSNGQYRVPTGNPFQGAGQAPEIYAYGLRNPYRFAFDIGGTNDLILADVGQGHIEEINRIVRSGNYGWAIKEGTFTFDRDSGNTIANDPEEAGSNLIDPIQGTMGYLQYDHDDGISITGGFVYRGSAIPELVGKYVFGDLAIRNAPPRIDGRLFYADLTTGEINEFRIPQFPSDQLPDQLTVHGFGQDGNGELYAMVTNTASNGTGGRILIFIPIPEPGGVISLSLGTLIAISAFPRRPR